MSAPRRKPNYRIERVGREWSVYSDSEAAQATGGEIISRLDLRAARELRDRLRKKEYAVACPELDAHA